LTIALQLFLGAVSHMRKSLSVFSVLALSVGIAMSSAPAQAALPLMANNQEMPIKWSKW
jgi:hypothetical protein